MNGLISIIIPVYNLENYIERCLKSVINQTYSNIEIIIVNDGSTDNSGNIIDEFAKKDSRIKVLHKENTGVSDTRNRGLEIAKGDYIGFVDGDDEISNNMYQRLLENMKKYDADISHCGFDYITPSKKINFHGTGKILKQSNLKGLISLLKGIEFEPSTCTKLFSKNIIKGIQYPTDLKINEDLLFNVYAFNKSKTIIYEDVSLYKYYDTVTTDRKKYKEDNIYDVVKVASIVKDILFNSEIKNVVNNFYVGKLINVFKYYTLNKKSEINKFLTVKSFLKNSSNAGLKKRTLFVKYLLLYMPRLFIKLNQFYKRTYGKNNKW